MNKLIFLLCFLFLLFLTYRPGYNLSTTTSVVGLLYICMSLCIIILWLKGFKEINKFNYKFTIDLISLFLVLVLFSSVLFSILRSPDNFGTGMPILFFTAMTLILAMSYFINYHSNFTFLDLVKFQSIVVMYTGVIASIIAWLVLLNFDYWDFQQNQPFNYYRLYGWLGNPNVLGNMLGIAIVSCIFNMNRSTKRKIYYLIVILLTVSLIMTGSKGAIISTSCGIIIYFLTLNKFNIIKFIKNSRKFVMLSISISIFLIIGFNLMDNIIGLNLEVYVERVIKLGEDESSRFQLWGDGLYIFNQANLLEILFGHGRNYYMRNVGASAHNTYVELLVDYGLVVLLILLLLTLITVYKVAILDKKLGNSLSSLIYATLTIIILSGMFTTHLFSLRFEHFMFFFILFSMIFVNYNSKLTNTGGQYV
ncbi:O-antigen ligase family protein [Halalkalibacter sp. AB-rgal2]|uniref:O-antigen ligase family protein n=1 Tax=Halalkalibacter sp. AB-rgal2 TaxID=3242695 RepID=UPI00359DB8B4